MSAAVLLKTNKIQSSTEKQSSAIIVHKPKRTATSTRTIHTRQNKHYRLGAVRAGVVEARGRCSPAATVPAAVVFACGVRCCITEKKQNKITTEKLSSAIIVHEAKRTVTNTRTKHKAEQSLLAWLGAGGSTRSTRPLLSSSDGAR